MRLKVAADSYLEYRYELSQMIICLILPFEPKGWKRRSTESGDQFDWQLKSFRTEKSVKYENQYTDLRYLQNGEFEYMNAMSDEDEEDVDNLNWVAFKQQFFTSILLAEDKFESAKLISKNLVQNEDIDTVYTKKYEAYIPLQAKNGELAYNMNMYYGPVDYEVSE